MSLKLSSIRRAAEEIGCSTTFIKTLIRKGALKKYKIGKKTLISIVEFERLAGANGSPDTSNNNIENILEWLSQTNAQDQYYFLNLFKMVSILNEPQKQDVIKFLNSINTNP